MNTQKSGYFAMLVATSIWGCFTLLFDRLSAIPAIDVVAHRILWGFLFMIAWLGFKGRLAEIYRTLRNPSDLQRLCASAVLVALNWLGFVWAVSTGHALEAGIGYFLFPLISVAIGAFRAKQMPNKRQFLSLAVAAVAVFVLSIGIGRFPWIAIYLGITFALYAPVKAKASAGPVLGVAVENVILLPIAIAWLVLFAHNEIGFFASPSNAFWLIFSGVATGSALILFTFASRTISYFSVGMLFFWNPTLQAINAVMILGVSLSPWHKIALPIVGCACLIYVYDLWLTTRKEKGAK